MKAAFNPCLLSRIAALMLLASLAACAGKPTATSAAHDTHAHAEGEEEAVKRVAAVGSPHQPFQHHAERRHQNRRQQQSGGESPA